MKVPELKTRPWRGKGKSWHAVSLAVCILTIASAWPARSVQAQPFGEFRFLQAINTGGFVTPTIIHSGPFEGAFAAFDDSGAFSGFGNGFGFAFSHDDPETQDLDGAYRSRNVYGVLARAWAPGRKQNNSTELDHYSRYRKCNDDASLTFTITQMFIEAFDGGPHDPDQARDYNPGIEPTNHPQMVGSIEMEIVIYQRATRFAHLRGILALNLFVRREGEERWPHADFVLANSGGDIWRGAQLDFTTTPGAADPITQVARYGLTAPHRITVDLASVPTAPSCAISAEDATDDQGEFTVHVFLKARAETFFFSPVESSQIKALIRDPADLDNNEDGVLVDVVGAQRLAMPDSPIPPSGDAFEPDPNCVAP